MEGGDDIKALRDRMDAYFISHQREHELMAEALKLAREALHDKLESMNEMREQLNDWKRETVPRSEIDLRFSGTGDMIAGVVKSVSTLSRIVWIGMGAAGLIGYFLKR